MASTTLQMATVFEPSAFISRCAASVSAEQVLQQMGDAVPPGKAGWFLLIGQLTEDKFLKEVEGTNAKVVRTNLTEEQEKQLKEAFGARKHQK